MAGRFSAAALGYHLPGGQDDAIML